jgi:hypothetical protein
MKTADIISKCSDSSLNDSQQAEVLKNVCHLSTKDVDN